ncbi:hypothetical protein L3Q82_017196 [Scortum barcoo]|uniref:Uncharacterized protein n=1 Tax=Scortum barcoo TaxID=214431 RepID=A0ACB8VKV6_9TELE|nr:hypothetical protein L3Q82_017196 [Scortum barcoo]
MIRIMTSEHVCLLRRPVPPKRFPPVMKTPPALRPSGAVMSSMFQHQVDPGPRGSSRQEVDTPVPRAAPPTPLLPDTSPPLMDRITEGFPRKPPRSQRQNPLLRLLQSETRFMAPPPIFCLNDFLQRPDGAGLCRSDTNQRPQMEVCSRTRESRYEPGPGLTRSSLTRLRLLWSLVVPCAYLTLVLTLVLLLVLLGVRLWLQGRRRSRRIRDGGPSVAFFHPYCHAGGGGERVLWCSLRALMNRYGSESCQGPGLSPSPGPGLDPLTACVCIILQHRGVSFVVYTGDQGVSGEQILEGARRRFNVTLPRPISFVFLRHRSLVEAASCPHFTLLGQSAGSMFLGWEALTAAFVPDLFVDSMGFAFTLPIFRYLGGCKVASYVHYPTVSTDMLSVVRERSPRFNNADFISRNPLLSALKVVYYCCFALLYGLAGSCSDVIMVNSTWTLGHILALWRSPSRTSIVYPPCDVRAFLDVPLEEEEDEDKAEEGWEELGRELGSEEEGGGGDRKCHFIGRVGGSVQARERPPAADPSVSQTAAEERGGAGGAGVPAAGADWWMQEPGGRGEGADAARTLRGAHSACVRPMRRLQTKRRPFDELKRELVDATMHHRPAHHCVSVVECMAAGTIVLAHKSGGPKLDIVVPFEGGQTGFLADSEDSYAAAMETILGLSPSARLEIRRNAQRSVERFSDQEFEACFLATMEPLMGKLER